MRYYAFAIERSVSGSVVRRVDVPVRKKSEAEAIAKSHAAALSRTKAQTSLIRLLGRQTGGVGYTTEVVISAFRKTSSGRVVRA